MIQTHIHNIWDDKNREKLYKIQKANKINKICGMKTARDLILELYKEDHITKQEADTLLDAIDNKNNYYTQPTYQPYVDWTYYPTTPSQPWYTVT